MLMQPDYTINDACHDGFECGLIYILRYCRENGIRDLVDLDKAKLAEHLESKKPWRTAEEWADLIRSFKPMR